MRRKPRRFRGFRRLRFSGPLVKEVPRFREYRRRGIEVWHECADVDIAVWVTECRDADTLRKARNRAIVKLQRETDNMGNIPHHQLDIYVLDSNTDRFLGVVCIFGECPKGKPECHVPGCGAVAFLQQYENFTFDHRRIAPGRIRVLFDRNPPPAPTDDFSDDDEIPF